MASKRGPMADEDLLAIIARHEKNALGSPLAQGATIGQLYGTSAKDMTTLEIDRFNALNTYFARPLGNEVENSSSVVLPEFRDVVEWIKPQLMRIFMAARTPCVFDPENDRDIDQAEMETEAVRHVFMTQNEGFWITYDFVTDAMLLRNGYIKAWWDPTEETVTENYSGLTEEDLAELIGDDKDDSVEILEQRERQVEMPPGSNVGVTDAPAPMMTTAGAPMQGSVGAPTPQAAPQAPQAAVVPVGPITVFDIKIRRRTSKGRVRVECLPPEDVLPAPGSAVNLDKTHFVEHGPTTKTRSELIGEGYDPDIVDSLTPGKPQWLNMDSLARDQVADELNTGDDVSEADRSMQEIEVRDVTIRVDYDGDGMAELRQVLIAGEKILSNEEIEEVPIVSGVPKRMPHKHTGISLYDELADLQVIKSQLAREGLNNLRLANNGRTAVDWKNCNLVDLMTSRAGGVVRTNGPPGQILMPFQHPSNLMEQVLPMMAEVDKWREFRTGVGKDTMMPDADALQNVTASGQLAGMAAAGLKIELVARCLAEGLKDAFLKIRSLLIRHQNQPMQFRLRGKFVTVDPSTWRSSRSSVSPNVGLGSGNRPEMRQNLMLLGNAQKELASFGLVGPKQAYATFKRIVPLLGFEQPEQFAMDPDSDEFKQWQAQHPSQPNPAVIAAQTRLQAAQVQAQAGVQRAQMQEQGASQRAQAEVLHSALQSREDRAVDMAGLDMQGFIALAKVLAPIVAAQLKGDPTTNAGTVLRQDIGGLEGRA